MDIHSKKNKISNIDFKWYIDEMTSQLLIMEFDQNFDGKIDENENAIIKENYFNTLGAYNFYTHIKLGNKPILTKPIALKTTIEGMRVVYNFSIQLDKNKQNISLDFYDQDRFVAMIVKKEFIKSATPYKISEIDNDFYFLYRLEFK